MKVAVILNLIFFSFRQSVVCVSYLSFDFLFQTMIIEFIPTSFIFGPDFCEADIACAECWRMYIPAIEWIDEST